MKIFFASFLNFLWNDVVTHFPCHICRKLFLRLFNRKISRSSVILMHVKIPGFWNIIIKDRVVVNQYVHLDCRQNKIILHEDADIGPYTKIWTLGHQPNSENHELYGGDVTVGHHVWIASNVTILPGVEIGNGSVVASSSVVHKNIADLQIWAGNPAKFIKLRNNKLNYKLSYTPYFE